MKQIYFNMVRLFKGNIFPQTYQIKFGFKTFEVQTCLILGENIERHIFIFYILTSFFCSSFCTCSADSWQWRPWKSWLGWYCYDHDYHDNQSMTTWQWRKWWRWYLWIEAGVWQEFPHDKCVVNFPSLKWKWYRCYILITILIKLVVIGDCY